MTKDYIAEKFISSGIDIDEKRASMFALYCDMLVSWSGKMNLTSVTDEKEIVSRHFIDSLLPLRSDFVTRDAVCADIGTGAGFPGVPVAIMRPDTDMYLIDSLKKRLVFLDAVIRELGLENCRTLHTRAEDAAKEMKDEYNHRRRVIIEGLKNAGLDCFTPAGAFYAFPSIKGLGLTSEEFCERFLVEKHVAIVPGNAFGDCGEGHVRISYAASMESIKTAMERLAEFVKELKEGNR